MFSNYFPTRIALTGRQNGQSGLLLGPSRQCEIVFASRSRKEQPIGRSWEETVPYIRQAFLGAAFLLPLFWAWDWSIDPDRAPNTAFARLAAGSMFALLALLLGRIKATSGLVLPIYAFGVVLASTAIALIGLQLQDGYVMISGSIIIVIMAVAIVGPEDRISIPLILTATVASNALVIASAGLGPTLPGTPSLAVAVNLSLLHIGAAFLAGLLIRVNSERERRIFFKLLSLDCLATSDPLTGLPNRRRLQSIFEREVATVERTSRPLSLLMIDVDHFKKINDSRGHDIGDEVLCALAERWRKTVREVDTIARFGGEEFVVLLPETDMKGARRSAERLRAMTGRSPIRTAAGDIQVSISIGFTTLSNSSLELEAAIKRADAALYRAKRDGRDRVSGYAEHDLVFV